MMENRHTKEQVREFYNRVGWQEAGEGLYQNARYEDLRKVSSGYIQRCHHRVNRFIPSEGRYLLDAGSGPIQYPEYLSYSDGYQFRICLDISIIALKEARKRINDHGLFVVADVANLPFASNTFNGLVSLHTLHHVSMSDQASAYREFERTLTPGSSGVVVNGWGVSSLMRRAMPLVVLVERIKSRLRSKGKVEVGSAPKKDNGKQTATPTGTFVKKMGPDRLREMLHGMKYEIRCWRSVSVRFMRAMIHPVLGGRLILQTLFWLENIFPQYFGEKGQYPMVVLRKSK